MTFLNEVKSYPKRLINTTTFFASDSTMMEGIRRVLDRKHKRLFIPERNNTLSCQPLSPSFSVPLKFLSKILIRQVQSSLFCCCQFNGEDLDLNTECLGCLSCDAPIASNLILLVRL
ncbi:unnamed protein product [Citrullus colocynthis]|uniref:Uncharacterized protein n=1 Tax=Citrullus colocynthis TaxID=252529 RepID=A0ABP0XXR3_9ROSI